MFGWKEGSPFSTPPSNSTPKSHVDGRLILSEDVIRHCAPLPRENRKFGRLRDCIGRLAPSGRTRRSGHRNRPSRLIRRPKRRPTDAPVTRNGRSGGNGEGKGGRKAKGPMPGSTCATQSDSASGKRQWGRRGMARRARPRKVGEDAGRAIVGRGAWPCRPSLEGDKAQRGGRRGAYPNMCCVCDAERPGGKLRLGAGIGRLALSPSAGGATTTRVPCRAPSESPEVQGHRARPSESTVHINPHKTPQTEISVWLR